MPGLLTVTGALVLYAALMNMDTPVWAFLIPAAMMGIGNAGMWGPLATTATRDLPRHQAGAGAGIYNTTRTVGSVLGSSSIAAMMQLSLEAQLPAGSAAGDVAAATELPADLAGPFATAMAQSMLLPAAVMALGVVAVCFLRRPDHLRTR